MSTSNTPLLSPPFSESQPNLVLCKTIDHLPKLKKLVTHSDIQDLLGKNSRLGTYEQACLNKINTRICGHFVDEFTFKTSVGEKSLALILNTPSVYLREMVTFLNRFDAFKVLSHEDQLKVVKMAGYNFAATRLAYAYDPTTASYIIVTVS